MGNKVISFDSISPEKKSYTYTYADISMSSEQYNSNINKLKPNWRIKKNKDVDAVKNSVKNILTWNQGERILLPDFGNTIKKFLYEGINDINSEQIVNECKMLMTKWEPRVVIDRLFKKDSIEDQENNQVSIIMIWHVAGLPDEKYQEEIFMT